MTCFRLNNVGLVLLVLVMEGLCQTSDELTGTCIHDTDCYCQIASEPHFPVQEILNKFTEKWKVGCWKCMTEFFTQNVTSMPQGMNTIHTLGDLIVDFKEWKAIAHTIEYIVTQAGQISANRAYHIDSGHGFAANGTVVFRHDRGFALWLKENGVWKMDVKMLQKDFGVA